MCGMTRKDREPDADLRDEVEDGVHTMDTQGAAYDRQALADSDSYIERLHDEPCAVCGWDNRPSANEPDVWNMP